MRGLDYICVCIVVELEDFVGLFIFVLVKLCLMVGFVLMDYVDWVWVCMLCDGCSVEVFVLVDESVVFYVYCDLVEC